MDDAAELYGLPLDQFVTERAALAKALRSAGAREEAARVAKLAKPSAAAWVVNQLVRTQRAAVGRLFEAGDALRQAQSDVVARRGGAAALRAATAVKRAAIDELVGAARGLLDGQGHGPSEATLARVSSTLDAAALQDEARAQVRDGCLTRELEHIGLGDAFDAGPPPPAPPASGSRRRAATPERDQETERDRAAERERRQREREAQARRRAAVQSAERELAQAQARHERAAHEVHDARQRLDAASDALAAAERALTEAGERAEQVRRAQP